MFRKVALGAMGLLLVGMGYAYATYGSIARGGSGYAAKNICSGYFLSGFSPTIMKEQALAGASSALSNISYSIDEENQSVTTKLYGLFKRRAIYTPGIGCTLLPAGTNSTDISIEPLTALDLSNQTPWPQGRAAPDLTGRLDAFLEDAFLEEDSNAPRNTKAIVVIHNGTLIAEKYADGVSAETPLIGWSMAKSVTALLVGILVKNNVLDLDAAAPVALWQAQAGDPRAEISLDKLLRMSSGLEFNETYSAATDVTQMLSNEPDAAAFAANKPLEGPPDTIWSYSSGTTNIISAIIKASVGDTTQDFYEFSQQELFRRLGITTATFEADASGNFVGSSFLYASARDWARLGQFCLQNGIWKGEKILPDGWMDYLVTPTQTSNENQYGAHFWLNRDPENTSETRLFPSLPEDAYYMGGFQGQFVLIIPSKQLVITRFGFTPKRNHEIEKLAAQIIAVLDQE
ncbi:MAG: serine hydrolase [Pseudomonadota bacterium]